MGGEGEKIFMKGHLSPRNQTIRRRHPNFFIKGHLSPQSAQNPTTNAWDISALSVSPATPDRERQEVRILIDLVISLNT